MPGLRGWQVAERLQASRPWMKVLYTSGSGYDIVALQGGPEEVEFLQKPFSLPALARKVRELLDS
jgi:CheY-like chemotaxis protein